jgi:hypothetical protein
MTVTSARIPARAFCLSASNFTSSSLKLEVRGLRMRGQNKKEANALAEGSLGVLLALRRCCDGAGCLGSGRGVG